MIDPNKTPFRHLIPRHMRDQDAQPQDAVAWYVAMERQSVAMLRPLSVGARLVHTLLYVVFWILAMSGILLTAAMAITVFRVCGPVQWLMAIFGLAAACIGVRGVIAYMVFQSARLVATIWAEKKAT